jgi:hypothetical protein
MYFQTWINGYGYYYWTPPLVVSLFFLLSLGAVLLRDSTREQVTRRFRIGLLIVFVAGYLATIASVYLTFTPVGSDQILGMQGRYFVPLALLLLLAFPIPSWKGKLAAASSKWITIFLTTALSLNVLGIFLAFHVPCGTTFYQTGLCYRPLFRDFPSEVHASQPISDGLSLTQQLQVKCDGLTEVRVLPGFSSPGDNGTTRFTLQDGSSNQTLLDISIPNNAINSEDWYPLRFDPDWHSAGKQYILNVLGQNTASGQGLTLLYTTQSEFDLGELYENDQLIEEDIVLQYGCATGLRKLWLIGQP